MFPKIHGQFDGKSQVERKMKKKVKQVDSQNIGMKNLLLGNTPPLQKTLNYQSLECLSHLLL